MLDIFMYLRCCLAYMVYHLWPLAHCLVVFACSGDAFASAPAAAPVSIGRSAAPFGIFSVFRWEPSHSEIGNWKHTYIHIHI